MTTNKSPIVSDWFELRRVVGKFIDWLELNGHRYNGHQGPSSDHYQCDACDRLSEAKRVLGYPQ